LAIPVDKGATGRTGSMFAAVAKNQLVGQVQALFEGAGMDLRVIDIPEMAQRNISALVEVEGRAIAMLSLADEGVLFTVTAGGELYLSRRMEVTATQLLHMNEESVYEQITLEMQRSLDHFDRQYHTLPLAKVVLAPMGDTRGLHEYLSKNLYVPVEQLDLETVLDLSRVPELKNKDVQQRHFAVIGAALRHEETVL
jgi:MSHA biogenesis protein MshI